MWEKQGVWGGEVLILGNDSGLHMPWGSRAGASGGLREGLRAGRRLRLVK